MPLTLNVGVARKLGQPGYGSVGASCNLEVELDSGLIDDPEALQARLRRAYAACSRAVREELGRLATPTEAGPEGPIVESADRNGRAPDGPPPERAIVGRRRPVRPATAAQVQAIRSIAREQGADLEGLLRDEFLVGRAEELSAAQASRLIDTLRAAARI